MTDSTNPLSALEAAELAAIAAPIIAVLTNVANGDGSIQSLTGQGLILEANMIALLPTLQKIGVQSVANYLIEQINGYIASVTPTPAPTATPAPTLAPAS